MSRTLVQDIASLVDAYHRCEQTGNEEWQVKHGDALTQIELNELPSGSGFDSGSTIDIENSTANRVVIETSFHHMDEWGGYDGWTDHKVIITPSLLHGFDLRVTGRNRNDIKEYVAETFSYVLGEVTRCHDDCQLRQTTRKFLDHKASFTELKASL